jgi:hypothetical protein
MAGSMRRIIVVTCVLAASIVAACDRRESAWRDARREDSPESYRDYLDRYPAGAHAAEARAALESHREDEAWARAERLGTPEAWQRYLAGWPDGRHAVEARRMLIAFIPPPSAPRPESAPPAAEAAVDAAAGFEIQLGAWSEEALARAGFDRFIGAHADALAGAELRLAGPGESGDALWRLRAGPLDEAAARARCRELTAAGVSCVPIASSRRDGDQSLPFQ